MAFNFEDPKQKQAQQPPSIVEALSRPQYSGQRTQQPMATAPFMGTGSWGYQPQQQSPAASVAGANRYQAATNLQAQLARLPYDLASAVVPSQHGADAAKYGANQAAQAQVMSSYYPAAAQLQGQREALPYQLASTTIPAYLQADASKYDSDRSARAQEMSAYYPAASNLQAQLASLPYQLASATVPAAYAADAAKYGADRGARAEEMAAYYPAAAQVQTAAYQPWAYAQAARMNALAQQNMAQIEAERSRSNLRDLLGAVMPAFYGGGGGGQAAAPGFTTSYGAGFSWT